jgi:hypothetical protein
MRMFDYNYIHPGFVFIPYPSTTPGALWAQYLIPNLMPKSECLSIRPFLPFGPRHHVIPQIQRKQSFCRTEANCRPQVFLPNLLKKPFPTEQNLLPSLVHKSASFLYQFLVLTAGSQSLRREDTVCGNGVAVRWRGVLHDLFAPEGLYHNLSARSSVVFCLARRVLIYISSNYPSELFLISLLSRVRFFLRL